MGSNGLFRGKPLPVPALLKISNGEGENNGENCKV